MCGWYDEDISKIGQQVPESDRRISGKREAGGKPARSRHCKQGAPDYAHVKTAWQPLVFGDWEGNLKCVELRARKPACCWYRSAPLRTTRNWSCRKAYGSWVFLCCHSASRKAFFVCGKRPFSAMFRGMQTVLYEQKERNLS